MAGRQAVQAEQIEDHINIRSSFQLAAGVRGLEQLISDGLHVKLMVGVL